MVIDVLDVAVHHAADGHVASLVMGATALKGRIGQLSQHAGKLPAADFKERQGVFQRLIMREKSIDIGCFIGV